MKITRNTKRANGRTVGEAMDRDAAALRSRGVAAKDGAKPLDERQEDWRERCRSAILSAFDILAAGKTEGELIPGPTNGTGWKDRDLMDLFPAIDKHADKLFARLKL
jgi:hypothetical protein